MRVHVLGSAAGGGFPQWNCGCPNCRGLREGTIRATARTQASVAVSTDEGSWFVVHASPDISHQVAAFPPLHPRALRDSPIGGIFLTNGDLDQCLGLLLLRESQPLNLYATDLVRRAFTEENRFYQALGRMPGQTTWHGLKLGVSHRLPGAGGRPGALSVTAWPVPGKVPLYLEKQTDTMPRPEHNVALLFTDHHDGRRLVYAPSVGGRSEWVDRLFNEGDCLFFDGTFWSDDELPALGAGTRTASEMAHWPLAGADGSLSRLAAAKAPRRILIHINNTNPILQETSRERQKVERAGVEVAYDGMEVLV